MRNINFRTPKPFGQRSNSKEKIEKKKYLLVVEGSKTEIDYFNGIFNYRKELDIDELIDITVVEREEVNRNDSHPNHLLQGILKKIGKIETDEEYECITYKEEIDEVWLIFDRDEGNFSKEQFADILRKCNENKFKIGLTNPTFEFWLLLHFPYIEQYKREDLLENRRENTRKRYLDKLLSEKLNGYNKLIQFEKIKDNINLAIAQEKYFEQRIPEIFETLVSNIGTMIAKMKLD